jgi:hypothetical protein
MNSFRKGITVFRTVPALVLLVQAAVPQFAARAAVERIEINSRADVLGGKPFGLAGSYEKLAGKVFFAVDPANPRNKAIVDLDKAPRDAKGRVLFSADLYVLAPKETKRGNGVTLFDVVNRGRKNLLGRFNGAAAAADPRTEADFGDGFLMRAGYTLVWVGWQFDVPRRNGAMALDAPVISDQGKPVTGRVSTMFTPDARTESWELDRSGYYDVSHYPPVDPAGSGNQLTVRAAISGVPRVIPRDEWQFDGAMVTLKSGFEAGQTYELSYEAKDPVVAGLGFAALRDLAAYVKHPPAGSVVAPARYTYVFGPSQNGRFLRDFLYQGFNADEQNERAFDGVMAHIAGAARGEFNVRFARPNGLAAFVATRFPFLDSPQHDPVTGKTDGLLARLTPETLPKIIYTNSSTEYWGGGRSAALTHTTLDGKEDAMLPANLRIYLFAGTQHGPAALQAVQGQAQQRPNPNDYMWGLRALLVAMDRWVREDVPPPPSRYPKLSDNTLVPQQRVAFPAIPGVQPPSTIPGGYRADLEGPSGHPLPFLVPQVDADGNELGGIRFPEIAVPVATYTGWNFRSPKIGTPGEILPLEGSYIPFAATRAAREQHHDPRKSIEERYASRDVYLGQVTEAALKLVQEGYVLREDMATIVNRAQGRWQDVTK